MRVELPGGLTPDDYDRLLDEIFPDPVVEETPFSGEPLSLVDLSDLVEGNDWSLWGEIEQDRAAVDSFFPDNVIEPVLERRPDETPTREDLEVEDIFTGGLEDIDLKCYEKMFDSDSEEEKESVACAALDEHQYAEKDQEAGEGSSGVCREVLDIADPPVVTAPVFYAYKLDYPKIPGVDCKSCLFHRLMARRGDEPKCSLCYLRLTHDMVFGK